MHRHISFSSHREYRFYQGPFASCVANGIQAVNFLGDRFLRKSHSSAGIEELYTALGQQRLFSEGSLSGHGGAARIRLLSAGLCLVLSRCARSRDHPGFRGCRPQGSPARKKRPADAGGRSRQCRHDDHRSCRQRPVHRRQLLLAAVGYAVGHPRGSGTDHARGPKGIFVSGDGARRACRPLVACRVSRGPEEGDISTRERVGAVRRRRPHGFAV